VAEHVSPEVLEAALALAALLTPQPEPAAAPAPADEPWTVPEAAAHLKVHESTLYRAIQKGRLGAYSVGSGGRAIRIPPAELQAFKARGLIQVPA
jgi:excisionase family DNA binding protein